MSLCQCILIASIMMPQRKCLEPNWPPKQAVSTRRVCLLEQPEEHARRPNLFQPKSAILFAVPSCMLAIAQ